MDDDCSPYLFGAAQGAMGCCHMLCGAVVAADIGPAVVVVEGPTTTRVEDLEGGACAVIWMEGME